MIKRSIGRIVSVGFAAIVIGGCNTLGYYFQAINGHVDLMRRAIPIEEVIADRGAEDPLSRRLAVARAIRNFASREMALPENGSYRGYADLGRSFVLWNVFAAPELSVLPAESCFPFAGCVTYRGFFAEADARAFAQQLARQGLDTYVGGVAAYSTLGWFDDPVLSTFINFPDAELARIIFHELAHQVVYVRDDTRFNESFAVAVEREGSRRWIASQNPLNTQEEFDRWAMALTRRDEFLNMLMHHRSQLAAIYETKISDAEKRIGKAMQLQRMTDDYALLKKKWGGFSGYDRFFSQGANNALLASVASYSELVPGFTALIQRFGGDMRAFYAHVKELSRLDKLARANLLRDAASTPSN